MFLEVASKNCKSFHYTNYPQVFSTVILDLKALLRRLSGEGNGIPLWYSCLENPRMEEPDRLQFMGSLRVRHN